MPTTCDISFDNNPQGVFYSGQFISGKANLHTTTVKTIRGIRIQIRGYVKVRFSKAEETNAKEKHVNKTMQYKAFEEYLNLKTQVVGGDDGNDMEFPPGLYHYPFQFHLPHGLPSAFEGEYGHIRYEVVLTINRPFKFDNVFTEPFTIISTLNLNTLDIVKLPKGEEESTTLNCCYFWRTDKQVYAKMIIPYSGYAPGQKIPYTLLVKNSSRTDCLDAVVCLKKTVQFESRDPHLEFKYERHLIDERSSGKILKHSNKEFKDYIQLPSLPPSTMDTCEIINIRYALVAKILFSSFHSAIELEIPVVIGTLPLTESTTSFEFNGKTTQVEPKSFDGDKPPDFDTIVPPGYEAAIISKPFKDEDETNMHMQRKEFIPKFPVFYNYVAPSAPSMPWIDDPRSSRIIPND